MTIENSEKNEFQENPHEKHQERMYGLIHQLKAKISFYPAANIAGFDDVEAWKIRDELIKTDPDGVVQGLAGITTEKAWQIRESLIEVCPHSVARSLVGLDDEKAWLIRDMLANSLNKEGVANGLAESAAFIDNDKAWNLRDKFEDICPLNVLESLNGLDSQRAWEMREKYKNTYLREVAASLIGVSGDLADNWRKSFLNIGQISGVIGSYLGSDDPLAWDLRERYLEQYPFEVGTSLAGLESDRSWSLRNKINELAEKTGDERAYKGLCQSLSPYMSAALKLSKKERHHDLLERTIRRPKI